MSTFDAERTEAALLEALLTVSTLQAAVAVRHDAAERRAGRDPSTQEADAVVRPYLHEARAELQDAAHRLRAVFAYTRHAPDEDHAAALVRRFDALLTLRRIIEVLGTVHRRLLSLYPSVDETLVEASRHLHGACRALLDAADAATDDAAVEALVDEALAFSVQLEGALGRG